MWIFAPEHVSGPVPLGEGTEAPVVAVRGAGASVTVSEVVEPEAVVDEGDMVRLGVQVAVEVGVGATEVVEEAGRDTEGAERDTLEAVEENTVEVAWLVKPESAARSLLVLPEPDTLEVDTVQVDSL